MKRNSEKGLTLVEVILGLTITGLIFAILLAALSVGYRSQEKGLKREERSQRMRILTDRLTWLLRGAYPYIVERPGGKKLLYFSGVPEKVGFVTTSVDIYSSGPEDITGLKWVELFVDGKGLKIKEKMYFIDNVFESVGKEYVFDRTVKSIRFEYLDTGEKEDMSVWTTEWNPEEMSYLPSAVKIEIVLEHDGEEIYLPPIVAAIRAGHG